MSPATLWSSSFNDNTAVMPRLKSLGHEPRYVSLKRELRAMVLASEVDQALPSYTEMIRRYGVGQSTIDRVIREMELAGLIVRKAGKGIFVTPRAHQKAVGFVLGRDIIRSGYSPIGAMLLEECRNRALKGKESFKFYLDLQGNDAINSDLLLHRELANDIKSGAIDGVILVWSYGPEETAWIRSHHIPIVSLGAEGDIDSHAVIIDYIDLICKGVAALAGEKCRKIAWLTPSGHLRASGFTKDIDAFRASLMRHGLKFHPQFILEDSLDRSINAGGSVSNEKLGFLLMQEFLAQHLPRDPDGNARLPFDGLVCEDDMFMRGALSALHQASVSLDGPLVIATHANKGSSSLESYADKLIFLEIDPQEVAEALFTRLEKMMHGEDSIAGKLYVQPTVTDHRTKR